MAIVSLKSLLEAGVHFGHRTKRWNPKMKPYIFTERNGVHIIDLQQTVAKLEEAYDYIRDIVADGGVVLFVGTKRQASEIIVTEAERCGMPFVNKRWLGGTMTNFRTIRARVDDMIELERRREYGEFNRLPKKEVLKLNEEIERLNRRVGGLRVLESLPTALFVVDIRREDLAIKEGSKLDIPIVAIVDTNCNPDPIDMVIPSNDDAIRAIKLMVGKMSEAVLEGQAMRETLAAEAEEQEAAQRVVAPSMPIIERELTDDDLLGPSTLAKMEEGIGSDELDSGRRAARKPERKPEPEVVVEAEVVVESASEPEAVAEVVEETIEVEVVEIAEVEEDTK